MVSVTASCMQVESHEAWKRATNKISKRKYRSNYQRKGLYTLPQINIDSFDHVHKECLLDLALFPADKKISADALLDIWVYVEKLQRSEAFAILSELADRNLLNLTGNPRGSTIVPCGNASELYISQRDVIRDLVFDLGHEDNILHRKRLSIERKNGSLLGKHELLRGRAFDTRILCILTGRMEENDWYDMNFPETEALLLLFTSTEYFLPPFLKSMKKLKFLMISNCGTNKATVKGLDILSSLTQLKSVRLERLISPLGGKQGIEALQYLEKLSLSLCEGFENIPAFTSLQDLNLDHNNDLEELPLGICNIPSIVSLSITNCHQLQNLPYDFGKMSNLRMLKLSELPCLEQLPASIGKLEQLEYLDISLCEILTELPKEIGQLKKLRELDMRECSNLTTLPSTVCELHSLKLVTCDETIGKQWLRVKNTSIPELRVEIVEAYFSLDWLDV
ncbi:probable disease resistance protein At4g33300 [Cryptomeria japonica]|uniref:probable disease resistance protein At4g33300 n=1 Tax=Cryptomeria japonica TaxID=3369 RepID=UPI0027D9E3D0|nr:probable disease resistance protein At4g33300 [Cryptomeria japonica]